ncbi:MAG: methyltransferase domain-containing protein [Deltaproteobacteria bacterium]|nr:methyltransferase domain-containing protein [Deltaproteobacteria bacterium]
MSDDGEVRLDRLSRDRQVLQRARGHRSGTDDIVAAWSASRAAPDAQRVLDLGCGHGTVTLLLSACLPEAAFVSVEAQEISADLCRRNMALNGLDARVDVRRADLRELDGGLGTFDLVTGTPPFMPPGSGVLPQDAQRAAARFELRGGIEAYCSAAARYLAPKGCASMVMDGAQDVRSRAAFAAAGLHLRSVRRVVPRTGKVWRYIAYVGGLQPGQVHEEEIVVRDDSGDFTPAWTAVRQALRLD